MNRVLIATAIMAAFGAVITPLGVHLATDNLDSSILAYIAFLLAFPGLLGLSVLYPILTFLRGVDTAALAISGAVAYGALALFSGGLAWCVLALFRKACSVRDDGESSEIQP